jgi:predicted RNase H-like HicB family nuclease
MSSLANYEYLTIRISRVRGFQRKHNHNNGCFVAKSDEIPGCAAHGSTISDALNNFQRTAELWLKWLGSPQ